MNSYHTGSTYNKYNLNDVSFYSVFHSENFLIRSRMRYVEREVFDIFAIVSGPNTSDKMMMMIIIMMMMIYSTPIYSN